MSSKLRRLRKRMARTRRGDGFATTVTVIRKPELGERVRLDHRVDGQGQYVFDYPPQRAEELGRDLLAAAKQARELTAELDGETVAPAMAIPKGRRRR